MVSSVFKKLTEQNDQVEKQWTMCFMMLLNYYQDTF